MIKKSHNTELFKSFFVVMFVIFCIAGFSRIFLLARITSAHYNHLEEVIEERIDHPAEKLGKIGEEAKKEDRKVEIKDSCTLSTHRFKDTAFQPKWDEALKHCRIIEKYSEKYSLDPIFLTVLIAFESRGDPYILSTSGAVGLMQVMPSDGYASTYMCLYGPCFADRPTTKELLDPEFNVEYGSRMLANLIATHGIRDGLFHYGPEDVGYAEYTDLILKLWQEAA